MSISKVLFIALLLAGCAHGGSSGYITMPKSWVDEYFEIETKFKETIPADRLIKGEGENYRVPYLAVSHDADMRRRMKLADAGP